MKIIGLFPLTGNGGIASWAKKFVESFPDEEHEFTFVNVSPPTQRNGGFSESFPVRAVTGVLELFRIQRELRKLFRKGTFDVLHITTSGSLGTLRDLKVAKLCKKHGVKTIMHCHYGCITEAISSKGYWGWLLRRAMEEYDLIWVLDSRSFDTLKGIDSLKEKVSMVPNSIDVPETMNPAPMAFDKVAFIGNLYPEKGLFELLEACLRKDMRLDIVGPGTEPVIVQIKKIAGPKLNENVFIHGMVPNAEALKIMNEVDILALPTYYNLEAFPISIMEAMSLSKMVISCPRAAIEDILTGLDGKPCGLLVQPRSADAIVDAIDWCRTHKEEAGKMCMSAYEKVKKCYRKELVYDFYRENYHKLVRE